MIANADTKPAAKRPRKMAREPKSEEANKAMPKQESKTRLVLGILQRQEGTTIDQLIVATGWLPHTVRAALTGLKKNGHVVTSNKAEGQGRIHRVVAP